MSEDLKQMANRIKECMKAKGLKQVDIVKTTGVSKGSISKWLAGKAKPSGEYLLRLSQVLGESEYWLLNGEYPYSSYEDIDDAMDYMNAYEESMRDHYITELGLEPRLPYSIRFLKEEFENKIVDIAFENSYLILTKRKTFDELLEQEYEEFLLEDYSIGLFAHDPVEDISNDIAEIMIKHFEEKEEYEKCFEIKKVMQSKLIDQILKLNT